MFPCCGQNVLSPTTPNILPVPPAGQHATTLYDVSKTDSQLKCTRPTARCECHLAMTRAINIILFRMCMCFVCRFAPGDESYKTPAPHPLFFLTHFTCGDGFGLSPFPTIGCSWRKRLHGGLCHAVFCRDLHAYVPKMQRHPQVFCALSFF